MSDSKKGDRYSGTDSQPWLVKGSKGAVVFDKDGKTPSTFTVYRDAEFEARKYREATGEFAQPVRQ